MSKLEELINELCPDGVTYKNLGSFCKIQTGRGITNKDTLENGLYPVISGGVEPMGYYTSYNRNENTVTIARAGSAGYVNFIKTKFYLNDKCFSVIPLDMTNTKYLYYSLKNIEDKIIEMKSTGSVPTVNTEKVSKIIIPIPPLPIQEEVVRILDSITELTAELTAELQNRKKQYEHYRDKLILNNDYPRVKLSEITIESFRGSGIKRDDVTSSGVPCIRYGEIYTSYGIYFNKCISHTNPDKIQNKKVLKKNDLLFAITGESVEDIAKTTTYIGDEEGLVGGDIFVIRHNQNAKYLSYALSTSDAINQKGAGKVKSKVVHSNGPSILGIEIPLPDLDEQQRIVSILDSFNDLTASIIEGLPAEIDLRQKQYEYYRNKLLTFN